MTYFAYGWPRALASGSAGETPSGDVVYISLGSDYLVIVYASVVQVWTGGQHRMKIGELVRSQASLQEEGSHIRAQWCPGRKCLAVLTDNNHLLYYGLLSSKEALWRFPDGREMRRVRVYLQNSLHLDYGAAARVVDLTGDSKAVVAVLSSGALQVFSWQGQLRGQANPFTVAYEGSRGRAFRARSIAAASAPNLLRTSSGAGSGAFPAAAAVEEASSSGSPAGATAGAARGPGLAGARSGILSSHDSLDFPLPTPTQPQEVVVRNVNWAPSARLMAIVLEDGRCALCRTPDTGMMPVEQVHFLRWVYKPAKPSLAATSAAINPVSHMLALGLAHGRVAIYPVHSLLSVRRGSSTGGGLGSMGSIPPDRASMDFSAGMASTSGQGSGTAGSAPATAGQPDPERVLSLTDWGYSSFVTGGADIMQWSPDGRVLAVGYGRRGLAVWTPSGCRLMCSLRQAAPTAMPASAAAAPGLSTGRGIVPATPRPPGASGSNSASAGTPMQPTAQRNNSPGSSTSPTAKQLLSQPSMLNPTTLTPEVGVLEGALTALCWGPQGYQLLVSEEGEEAPRLLEQDFARFMVGQHRVTAQLAPVHHHHVRHHQGGQQQAQQSQQQRGAEPPTWPANRGQQGVHALQAADRVLIITENQPAFNAALAGPAAGGPTGEVSQRPDLSLQHVRVPQQYIESNYPLLHAAISPDRGDIAVAGTRGLAVYARRAQRWRMFGDVAQERQLRVQRLVWLQWGVVAACAYVESGKGGDGGGGTPQLLLYPRHHLDNASLLARVALPEMPVAADSAGSYLLLAFPPLDVRVMRVELDRGLGAGAGARPSGAAPQQPVARVTTVRELSILGLGSPLQEIALVEPDSWHGSCEASGQSTPAAAAASEPPSPTRRGAEQQQAAAERERSAAAAAGRSELSRATQRAVGGGGSGAAHPPGEPVHCVLLRAGGILSLLDMEQGTEQMLSDEIERFWLPSASATPAAVAAATAAAAAPHSAMPSKPQHAGQRSEPASAWVSRNNSEASFQFMPGLEEQQEGVEDQGDAADAAQDEPHVEMPWWTYGSRGMQLWFPSLILDPAAQLDIGGGGMLSPRATASAVARAPANSTDPELEFDREVYPIGISLAEVSIVGVTQRIVRSNAFPPAAPQSLCFHPLPESQPVLPCLLRRLLQKGKLQDAQELAKLHSGGPHFSRSLEWLLFTALEIDCEQQREASVYGANIVRSSSGKEKGLYSPRSSGGGSAKRLARAGPLLMEAARLVAQFPQYAELVVSVARKTDAQLWPSLFAAVGSPAALGEGLRAAGDLQSAACCLLIVDHIEGTATAHALALRLIKAALRAGQYELVAELLRFLLPPGETEALLSTLPLDSEGEPAQPAGAAGTGTKGASGAPAATGSWLWSLFGSSSSKAAAEAGSEAAAGVNGTGSEAAAGGGVRSGRELQAIEGEFSFTPVIDACRLIARHAWKLLDSGALRQLVSLAAAVSSLPGGLAMLLRSAGRDLPVAQPHLEASPAGVASALFVALNEFPGLDTDMESLAAAELLAATCSDAGCANHSAALGLLLHDQRAVGALVEAYPHLVEELGRLLAKDAYLAGFAEVLQAGWGGGAEGAQAEAAAGEGKGAPTLELYP